MPLPEVVLFNASAEANPKTLSLARDVLRLPPLDGSAPVSASASEIPTALARKATASPLNVVAACAKLKAGLRVKIATKQIVIAEFFFVFILNVLLFIELELVGAAVSSGDRSSR